MLLGLDQNFENLPHLEEFILVLNLAETLWPSHWSRSSYQCSVMGACYCIWIDLQAHWSCLVTAFQIITGAFPTKYTCETCQDVTLWLAQRLCNVCRRVINCSARGSRCPSLPQRDKATLLRVDVNMKFVLDNNSGRCTGMFIDWARPWADNESHEAKNRRPKLHNIEH